MGPALQQPGEGLAFDGDGAAGGDGVDDGAAEDVGPGVDLVGDDLLGRLRLLQEGEDAPGLVGGDEAEGARVLDAAEVEGDVGAALLVGGDEGRDVEPGEDVAVEDEDGVVGPGVEPVGDVADGAAGAEGLLLGDVLEVEPEVGAVTEVRLEDLGEVRGGHHHVFDAGGAGAGQLVGEEGDARGGHHRLRRAHRERPQPGALAADQEDRFWGLSHCASLLPAGAGRTVFRPASLCRPVRYASFRARTVPAGPVPGQRPWSRAEAERAVPSWP